MMREYEVTMREYEVLIMEKLVGKTPREKYVYLLMRLDPSCIECEYYPCDVNDNDNTNYCPRA